VQLTGARVVLRPLRVEDVERVAAIHAEPDVARWWGAADIDKLRRKAAGAETETVFVIELDGEVVGLIQYDEEDHPDFRHANIDLFLAGAVRGRGIGPDAIRTLARHLVTERNHHRLTIDPAVANRGAVRAYEKVGFRPVGVMRKYWRAPDGTWQDGLLMDLLADELE